MFLVSLIYEVSAY